MTLPLPKLSRSVTVKLSVTSDDGKFRLKRLGDERAVEGIPVVRREILNATEVPGQDGMFSDVLLRQALDQFFFPVAGNRQVTEPTGGKLQADQKKVLCESRVSTLSMKSRSISASSLRSEVRRSTTSRGIFPARNPTVRVGRSAVTATRRATGLSHREMTTSSPCSTSAISRESCVFAS